MSLFGLHDTTHDMYQPNKRAKPVLPRIAKERATPCPPAGDRNARDAWMRQKQTQGPTRPRGPRIEQVFTNVCREFEVTRGELLGKSRSHAIAQARGQACRELRKSGMSYPDIARAMNLGQHSSVIHHCKKQDVQAPATDQQVKILAAGDYGRPMPPELASALEEEIGSHMRGYGLQNVRVVRE
jgi:hypothetical protein